MGFIGHWFVVFLLFQLVFLVLKYLADGVTHAQVFRIYELLNIQFFMALATYLFFHYRYKPFLQKFWPTGDTICKLAFFFVIFCAHLAYIGHYIRTEEIPGIALLCFLSVAFFIHLMVFSIGFTLGEHIVYWTFPLRYQFPIFTSKSLHTGVAILLSVILTSYGMLSTRSEINVYKVDVQLNRLPVEIDGFTIALITDVHIGPTVHRNRVKEIVDVVNKLNVDAVAISGDLVDGFVYNLDDIALEMTKFKTKFGVYYATGNHEYYHDDVNNWLNFFRTELSFNVLHNENRIVKDGLCIAGVDDYHTRRLHVEGHLMDPVKAFKGCPLNHTLIVLAHQPNAAIQIMKTLPNKADLILSGHTHAGQLYVLWPVAYLGNSFLHGLYQDSLTDTQIFVSAGVNYWGPPVKMWQLCEIPLIRLRAP